MTTLVAADQSIVAPHGDSWASRRFAVAIANAAPKLTEWDIRAEVRGRSGEEPLFSWFASLGHTTDTGIELGGTRWRLRSGAELDLPTIQLRLRARDWIGKPIRWAGYLEIELTRGPAEDPVERYTPVRRRRFEIVPDLVP